MQALRYPAAAKNRTRRHLRANARQLAPAPNARQLAPAPTRTRNFRVNARQLLAREQRILRRIGRRCFTILRGNLLDSLSLAHLSLAPFDSRPLSHLPLPLAVYRRSLDLDLCLWLLLFRGTSIVERRHQAPTVYCPERANNFGLKQDASNAFKVVFRHDSRVPLIYQIWKNSQNSQDSQRTFKTVKTLEKYQKLSRQPFQTHHDSCLSSILLLSFVLSNSLVCFGLRVYIHSL